MKFTQCSYLSSEHSFTVLLDDVYNFFLCLLCSFRADIPHTDSGSGYIKNHSEKSPTQTLTKFPRSDESEDEDKTDVCSACLLFHSHTC